MRMNSRSTAIPRAARQAGCVISGCGISLRSRKSPMLCEAVCGLAAIRGSEYPLRMLPFEPRKLVLGDCLIVMRRSREPQAFQRRLEAQLRGATKVDRGATGAPIFLNV